SGYAAIACLVTSEDVFELFKDDASDPMNYFRDISTFGGCTAGPAAAIENMAIIEEEGLLDNTLKMGERMIDNLNALSEKHAELVADRATKDPAEEKLVQAVVADCAAQGVLIGATNRSIPGYNNTLCFSPALIATTDDIDEITEAVDRSLTKVFG
ncbi:aspartate aminotransferase family protein, partial [Paracoccaceae bacterium]|nr:aspartate aminotransferase family protein [Paracoccaceae bacterium]